MTWNKATYEQVAGILESNFRIPKTWLYELSTYDAADLLGGIIGVVSTALYWNRADTETFSKLVGGLGLSAVRGANPLLLLVTVVALARAFHKAHHEDDYAGMVDGALKGALGTGATLAAVSQVGVLGGPAGLALLAGVCAGVLAHKATEKVAWHHPAQLARGRTVTGIIGEGRFEAPAVMQAGATPEAGMELITGAHNRWQWAKPTSRRDASMRNEPCRRNGAHGTGSKCSTSAYRPGSRG